MSDPRFAAVEAQYRALRAAFDAGRMDAQAFEAALEAAAFEHAGRWWMIGSDSGRWYASAHGSWVPADPRVTANAAGGSAARAGRPEPPSTAARPPGGSKLRSALGWALLAAPLLLALGVWLTQYAAENYWDDSDLGTSFLVAGMVLASASAIARYEWIPRLPALIIALLWTGLGFAAIAFELGLRWWPDVMFAIGCAAVVGVVVGTLLRRILARQHAASGAAP